MSPNRYCTAMGVFCFLVLLVFVAASVDAVTPEGWGQILWCDPTRALYGYALTEYGADNVLQLAYYGDPYYLRYEPWVNGRYVALGGSLLTTSGHGGLYTTSNSYSLPLYSIILGPFAGDNSYFIVPNTGAQSDPIIACCTSNANTIIAIANGTGGANPASYPGGVYATSNASQAYQAGQGAPGDGASFYPPANPPLPVQSIDVMVAARNQATDSPQPPYSPAPNMWRMKNKAMPELKINGQTGAAVLAYGAPFQVTVEVHPTACLGQAAEAWVGSINRNNGVVWWATPSGWVKQSSPARAWQGGLQDIPPAVIDDNVSMAGWWGTWDYYACIDMTPDGILSNPLICTTVRLVVNGP